MAAQCTWIPENSSSPTAIHECSAEALGNVCTHPLVGPNSGAGQAGCARRIHQKHRRRPHDNPGPRRFCSDLTASLVGAAINAEEIQFWKDVDGMLSCDPRILPGARLVKKLSYDEAAELANAGATILHPDTIASETAAHSNGDSQYVLPRHRGKQNRTRSA